MIRLCRDLNGLANRGRDPLFLVGRVLLCLVFVASAYDRLTGGWASSVELMVQHGVPVFLLPFVTALEVFGSLLLALGLLSRLSGLALAVFSAVAAFVFHGDFSIDGDWILFLDNVALAGGLLFVVGAGAGRWSLDHLLQLDRPR